MSPESAPIYFIRATCCVGWAITEARIDYRYKMNVVDVVMSSGQICVIYIQ